MVKTHNMIHCHTDLSNGTTNIDSVSKYQQYVDRAVEEGMTAIAFTEHGNMFSWFDKKRYCESKGIKYIHAIEMYVTKTLDEKIRDNYHVCMYARNFEGFKELNKLVSKAYNRNDNHFYYVPRISLEELINTSSNIIIGTACIGGGLRPNSEIAGPYLDFLIKNKDRCFLEVQHHFVTSQISYNNTIWNLNKKYGIPLILGTDTHALNETHAKGRTMLQLSKNIHFDNEDGWDITWKTMPEVISLLKRQGGTDEQISQAILNTHRLTSMVEDFEIDKSYKYPKLYDDSYSVLINKIKEGYVNRNIDSYVNREEYLQRIESELEAYKHNNAIDFLLLDEGLKSDAAKIGIYPGPSRGSVSGSLIAYLIKMTDMDPIKHKLNFERFMNTARVSLADVDTDWPPSRREEVKNILYNKPGLCCSEIVTFNTVALKGSVRDVCRALYTNRNVPDYLEQKINEEVQAYGRPLDKTRDLYESIKNGRYVEVSNYICKNIDDNEYQMRAEFPDIFEYVDIINGTVVSLGIHPCGTIVSPVPLDENVGLITLGTTDKPVSMLNMNEINDIFYVKLDILGLENIELINETCHLASIPRLTPDNVPDDEKVWKAIRDDTLGIFQWNGETGSRYIKHLFDDIVIEKIKKKFDKLGIEFKYIDLFSVGNGAIRPGGASYRDALSEGEFYDNGHEGINKLLAPTLGYLVYQEQIMDFLVQFCGYAKGEADIVRRAVAKKKNSEQYLPEIKRRFIEEMKVRENMPYEKAEKIIEVFLQVILDASAYLFSLNHAQAYSYIGYMCGWLREYYPLEFLTVMLNNASGDLKKTKEITDYAAKRGIEILKPTFGKSRGEYFFDKKENKIYKGISSVKYVNNEVADVLYEMHKENNFESFVDVLIVAKNRKIGSKHIEVLTKIGYFREFGCVKKLLKISQLYYLFTSKKQFKKIDYTDEQIEILSRHADTVTDKVIKNLNIKSLINELSQKINDIELPPGRIVKYEYEYIGSTEYMDTSVNPQILVVTEINTKYTPTIKVYRVCTGETFEAKIAKDFYLEKPLQLYDTIYLGDVKEKFKKRKVDGKWITTNEKNYYITYYLVDREKQE